MREAIRSPSTATSALVVEAQKRHYVIAIRHWPTSGYGDRGAHTKSRPLSNK
jgi:hypothetical protein